MGDVAVCPRCGTPHDGRIAASGQAECPVCDHRWNPTPAAGMPAQLGAAALTIPVMNRPKPPSSAAVSHLGSGEYLPNESGLRAAPLTDRVGDPAASRPPAISLPPLLSGAPAPSLPAAGAPAAGVSARRAAVQSRAAEVTVDSDLFSRAEASAQADRAAQHTVVDRGFAAAARDTRIHCPMCGHGFWPLPGANQSCPQCGASFDHHGDIAAAPVQIATSDRFLGRTIRGCLLDRKLGEGAMGTVYHARQLSLERSVAIKLLPSELARNKGFIARFEREAKTLAAINHPNILHIYDFGEDSGLLIYFMIIEFVDGTDLGEILNRQGTLSPLEVLDLLRQACSGLDVAAEKGIIHRDIKPDNLLRALDGTWKVADFGLAKGIAAEKEVTTTGVRVGTPAFMSPEQCDGVEADVRSDVYNLGVTAFLALTGQLPFDAETPFAIMLKHKQDPIPSLRRYLPELPESLDRLIARMLAKRPAERCNRVRELVEDIEAVMIEIAGTASILRASRGPFRAMRRPPGQPAHRVTTPSPAQAVGSSAAVNPHSNEPAPDWLKPVDIELPNGAPGEAATVLPVAPPEPPLPPRGRTDSSAIAHFGKHTDSSRVANLDQRRVDPNEVRQRSLRARSTALTAAAERHIIAGNLRAAIGELQEAAMMSPERSESEALRSRIASLERTLRRRRFGWRLAIIALVLALAVAGLRWVPPLAHAWLADQALESARRQPDPRSQLVALDNVIVNNQVPWSWWSAIFAQTYTIAAVNDAKLQRVIVLGEIQRLSATTPAINNTSGNGATAAIDVSALPLPQALEQLNGIIANQRNQSLRSHYVAEREKVLTAWTAATQAQAAIAAALMAGHHDQAITLAQDYPSAHRRLPMAGLPVAAQLDLRDSSGPVDPATVTIVADGVTVLTSASRPAVVARRLDREVVIQIRSPLHESQTVALLRGTTPITVPITLAPAPRWSVRIGSPGIRATWARLNSSDAGIVMVVRNDGISAVRVADGTVINQRSGLEAFSGCLSRDRQGRLLAGMSNGDIRHLTTALVPDQIVARLPAPPLAVTEHAFIFRTGAQALIGISGGERPQLIALESTREVWRYGPLNTIQQPLLLSSDDRLIVADDNALHVISEDRSSAKRTAYGAPLVANPVVMNGHWFLPTGTGVVRVQPTAPAPVLTELIPAVGAIAVSNHALLVHGLTATVELHRLNPDGSTQAIWAQTGLGVPMCAPAVTRTVAAVATDNDVLILDVETGALRRRITRSSPAAALWASDNGLVVVADRDGMLLAY